MTSQFCYQIYSKELLFFFQSFLDFRILDKEL